MENMMHHLRLGDARLLTDCLQVDISSATTGDEAKVLLMSYLQGEQPLNPAEADVEVGAPSSSAAAAADEEHETESSLVSSDTSEEVPEDPENVEQVLTPRTQKRMEAMRAQGSDGQGDSDGSGSDKGEGSGSDKAPAAQAPEVSKDPCFDGLNLFILNN
jgi:hypothetical protein